MPTQTLSSNDWNLAIHEAGHALMFDALGIPICFVTIEAGCGGEKASFEGCVRLGSDSNNVCVVIAGTLAGPAASFFIAQEAMDDDAMRKFGSDQETMFKLYKNERDVGTWDEFWKRLQYFQGTWLRGWVMKQTLQIQRFASSLLEKRMLSGEDLSRALPSAWAGSKPSAASLFSEVQATISKIMNDSQISQS